ncbi:MAG: inositol monophosphatase family protein [Planctomycetaceae bacterium]|jgi:histidinol phosphatase-like enzyme (inositol monophosphatase family)|nr:inositol monophosphatase family protein [Planctomycetaceae bacterium]
MERLEFAKEIVREAGAITLKYFYLRSSYSVERKVDASPVTVADLEVERFLRDRISGRFPDDMILGEEFSVKTGASGFKWLIDPIDGTVSFIYGVPIYSILVGIEFDGASVGGVIGLPALGEMLWAGKGVGAWHEAKRFEEPVRAKVSNCKNISDAIFLTSDISTYIDVNRRGSFENLERNVLLTRTWGDAYGYFLVATGRADVMVDPVLSDWDAGPLLIILEEAGGMFTDWQGKKTIYGNEGVASNGILHEEILQILQSKK